MVCSPRRPALVALIVLGYACSGCKQQDADPAWSGYVEGEAVQVAAPVAGTLTELAVQEGQTVAKGALLFRVDDALNTAAAAEAAARASAAAAQATDMQSGKRADELAVVRAQLVQAQAQARLADAELQRQRRLLQQGFVSRSRLDDASTAAAQAHARVAELQAARRVADAPARDAQQAAAQANAAAAERALEQARWREAQARQYAPAAGVVTEAYYRVGEYVPAAAPVLAVLPPDARQVRFYVPQAELGGLALGQALQLHCDGCRAPIEARITRIASQAEYTPPVIYSGVQRARMVFMIEARPLRHEDALRLHPGQPMDVRRAAAVSASP